MTYALDGVQHVAVLAGPPGYYLDNKIRTGPGRLLVFRLDGTATNAPNPVVPTPPIPPPVYAVEATAAELTEGGGREPVGRGTVKPSEDAGRPHRAPHPAA